MHRALVAALEADPTAWRRSATHPAARRRRVGLRSRPAPPIYSAGQALTRDGRAIEEAAGEVQRPEYLERREVFGVCGAACLLRRELFADLGGYDERYFAFYEDVDLNVRARIADWRFAYVHEAAVWHVGNASWRRASSGRAPRTPGWSPAIVSPPRSSSCRFGQFPASPWSRPPRCCGPPRNADSRRPCEASSAVLRWLPGLLRERRLLRRSGDPARARCWLGVRTVP